MFSFRIRRTLIPLFAGFSFSALFILLSAYAQELGASLSTIGLIVSIGATSTAFSFYYFGRLSDKRAVRKKLICAGLLVITIAAAMHYFAVNVLLLTLARIFYGIGIGMYTAPMIAYAVQGDAMKHSGEFFGSNSLGWGLGLLSSSVLLRFFEYNELFAFMSIFSFAAFLIGLTIPIERITKHTIPLLPTKFLKKNAKVYFSFFLRNISAVSIWALIAVYAISLGGSKYFVAMAFGMQNTLQFFVMNGIHKLKMSSARMLQIGLLGSFFVTVIVGLAPTHLYLIPAFLLLGFAYSFLFIGSILHLIEKNVERATVSGLLNSTKSMATIIGPLIGGAVAQMFGMKSMILGFSMIGLVAFLFSLTLKE